MEIKPHIGLGNLVFGMSKDQVETILGKPESTQKDQWPDNSFSETWSYSDQTMSLTFDESADDRLTNISSSYASIHWRKIPVIGLPEEMLLKLLPDLVPDTDVDFAEHGTDYIDSQNSLAFWVEGGSVKSLTIMVSFDEAGENPIWPE